MSCRHDLANGTCVACYPDTGKVDPGLGPHAPNLDGPGAKLDLVREAKELSIWFEKEGSDQDVDAIAYFACDARDLLPRLVGIIEAADDMVAKLKSAPHIRARYEGDGDPGCYANCPACYVEEYKAIRG